MYSITEKDFCDEISRNIFKYRFQYYKDGDTKSIIQMIVSEYSLLAEKIKNVNDRIVNKIDEFSGNVYIYGSGAHGKNTYEELKCRNLHHKVKGFLNTKVTEDVSLGGVNVLEVRTLLPQKDESLILVPEGVYAEEMTDYLLRNVFSFDNIIRIPHIFFMHNEMNELLSIKTAFGDPNTHFWVYGNSWSGYLFRWTVRNAGFVADLTVDDYSDNPSFSLVSDNLSLINNLDDTYVVVFDGIKKKRLLSQGVEESKIIHLVNTDELQYFDDSIVPKHKLGKIETFIDGGSLNLDTSAKFLGWCRGECKKIIAFEPDERCYDICERYLKVHSGLNKVTQLVKAGLWHNSTTLSFHEDGNYGSSKLALYDGNQSSGKKVMSVPVTSIDECLKGEEATFIKMDIEGAELEALKGARKTIEKYHPILAISVYHKPEDIISIPQYIKEIDCTYNLYLRNYHQDITECVLYAF